VRWILVAAYAWFVLFLVSGQEEGRSPTVLALAIIVAAPVAFTLSFRRGRRIARWTAARVNRRVRPKRAPPSADLLRILTMSPVAFEHFCRDVLEREGFQAVTTKQTGDQGIDVELRARDGRIGVAQCKQTPHTNIGRPTVQQLYGEMISRGATFGYIITTGAFTDEAAAFARTKTITLVDRDALLAMVDRQSRPI